MAGFSFFIACGGGGGAVAPPPAPPPPPPPPPPTCPDGTLCMRSSFFSTDQCDCREERCGIVPKQFRRRPQHRIRRPSGWRDGHRPHFIGNGNPVIWNGGLVRAALPDPRGDDRDRRSSMKKIGLLATFAGFAALLSCSGSAGTGGYSSGNPTGPVVSTCPDNTLCMRGQHFSTDQRDCRERHCGIVPKQLRRRPQHRIRRASSRRDRHRPHFIWHANTDIRNGGFVRVALHHPRGNDRNRRGAVIGLSVNRSIG